MKRDRHAMILNIIENNFVETQEELTRLLRENGFETTQATVSRDINDLRLVKNQGANGRLYYSTVKETNVVLPDRLVPVFEHAFVSSSSANNLIVLKTLSGMAQAVASAVDSMDIPDILGCVAGDDTILIVCKTQQNAEDISSTFRKIAGGYNAKNS